MADSGRHYWLKVDSRQFGPGGGMAYLLAQKNGAVYVVMYQMLCLATSGSGGALAFHAGGKVTPYTEDDIARELRYFTKRQVREGMRLFRELGMVADIEGGAPVLTRFDGMIGSESESAERVRKHRARKRQALHCNKNVTYNSVTDSLQQRYNSVTGEEREEGGEKGSLPPKNIKYINPSSPERESRSEREKGREDVRATATQQPGTPLTETITLPTREDCDRLFRGQLRLMGTMTDPAGEAEAFYDYYAARGWALDGGDTPCRDWKALARNWARASKRFRTRDGMKARGDRAADSPYAADEGEEAEI